MSKNKLQLLQKLIVFLNIHGARDKLVKVVHYGVRIIIERAKEKGDLEKAKRLESFRQAIGKARRVGWFLMSVESIPSLLDHFHGRHKEKNTLMWLLLLSADLSDFFYYLFDNIPFLVDYGIVPMDQKKSDW